MNMVEIKQKEPQRNLTIESIRLNLGREKKGRLPKRFKTLPTGNDLIFQRKKDEVKQYQCSPLKQLEEEVKETYASVPLRVKRWKSEERRELFHIKSSIKLHKRKLLSKQDQESLQQPVPCNIPRPVVIIKDYFQDRSLQTDFFQELSFFKHKSEIRFKNDDISNIQEQKNGKQPVSYLFNKSINLPRINRFSEGKKPLQRVKVKSTLADLEQCLIMVEQSKKYRSPFSVAPLSPWVTPGQQTKEYFYPSS